MALTRIGDVVSGIQPTYISKNTAELTYSSDGKLNIKSETPHLVEIFNVDGTVLLVKELAAGNNTIEMTRKGLFIVRLKNQDGFVSKKILI